MLAAPNRAMQLHEHLKTDHHTHEELIVQIEGRFHTLTAYEHEAYKRGRQDIERERRLLFDMKADIERRISILEAEIPKTQDANRIAAIKTHKKKLQDCLRRLNKAYRSLAKMKTFFEKMEEINDAIRKWEEARSRELESLFGLAHTQNLS